MKENKIKTFYEEHKEDIKIMTIGGIAGGIAGSIMYSKGLRTGIKRGIAAMNCCIMADPDATKTMVNKWLLDVPEKKMQEIKKIGFKIIEDGMK